MLNSKNYILFIVPYLTVVCSLYHTIYYGSFNLNGLSLLSITDIIKSAAYPMLLTFFSSVVGILFAKKILKTLKFKNVEEDKSKPTPFWEKLLEILFHIIFWTILIFAAYMVFGQLNYILAAFAVGNLIISFLDKNIFINEDIGIHIDKEFVLMMLVYFPCFSVAVGIQEAEKIIDNKSFKYTIRKSISPQTNQLTTDTLKLIGMNDDKYIFTDIHNTQVYFIKTDSLTLMTK